MALQPLVNSMPRTNGVGEQSASRRQKFARRGRNREPTQRKYDFYGRRSGILAPEGYGAIGDDGFEETEHFFPDTPQETGASSTRRSTRRSSSAAQAFALAPPSPAETNPEPSPTREINFSDQDDNNYGDFEDDGGHDDLAGDRELSPSPPPQPKPRPKAKKAKAKAKAAPRRNKRRSLKTPPAAVPNTPYQTVEVTRKRGSVFEQHGWKSAKKAKRDAPVPSGVRRSSRQRFAPLNYWKNERLMFEADDDSETEEPPVVTGVLEALPTPTVTYKRKVRMPKAGRRAGKGKGASADTVTDTAVVAPAALKPLKPSQLPKGRVFSKANDAEVWWEGTCRVERKPLVQRARDIQPHPLPSTGEREGDADAIVATASQAFNHLELAANGADGDDAFPYYPGWISGHLDMPSGGIKDAEGVGECTQVFYVVDCQPKSFEIAFGKPTQTGAPFEDKSATRFLLSAGDHFYVPPKNVYRMQNHSKTQGAKLFFSVVKPVHGAASR